MANHRHMQFGNNKSNATCNKNANRKCVKEAREQLTTKIMLIMVL